MIPADKLTALEATAASWVGTPFCEGTPVKGAGVACHHACAEIFFESGLTPRIPVPDGPSNWSAAQSRSLIVEWVEQSGLFVEVTSREAGDFLGFRLVNAVHHAAVVLGRGRIIHCLKGHGVLIAPCIPADWERRLEKIWRLKAYA